MAKSLYAYLADHSYDELWTTAVHTLGLPNTQVNSIGQKSYLATLVLETIDGNPVTEAAVRSSLRTSKAAKKNFRRERKLLFPRGR